jgi:signal transduction histidine kinase/CheY-like chemotaxis protein
LPDPAAAPADQALLARRVAAAQLQLMLVQLTRVPLPLVVVNMVVIWLAWRIGHHLLGAAWLVIVLSVDVLRWRRVRAQLRAPSPTPEPALRRFSRLFTVNAALQMLMIPLMFSAPVSDLQYIYTLVLLGRSAGAISTSGSSVSVYATWVALVGAPLATAWAWQGNVEGAVLAAMVVLLFFLLMASVRDQSRMLYRLVQVALENEQLAESVRIERDRARAASDSKTRFFAAASHDLRQPLHALSINTTTLEVLARRQGDPMMIELSQSIGRALRQSNSLLDSLLDISRLEANVVQVHRRPVQASALLHSLRDEFAGVAAQQGLALFVTTPAHADVWIDTDSKQMRRVLANLLSNALKFTAEGSVTLVLHAPQSEATSAAISVVDTGPGIAPAEHERVFEEFYQVGNPSRDRSQGLGLGLSIVKRTAALLGVEVRLTSSPGHGARFDVSVPVCPAPAATTEREPLALDPGDGHAELRLDVPVLAVDDEVDILESLAAMLPHFGCEVRCATGLAQAIAIVETGFRPSLLIVDHRLRDAASGDVIDALRERLGPLPVVVVTGDTEPRELQRVLSTGAQVVHKPIDGLELARVLKQALLASTV